MIRILHKNDCCGCSACAQVCHKHCIRMQADKEGFLYPIVNEAECVECGLCESVCPVLHQSEKRTPQQVYAAYNSDESIRSQSSSGGVFTLFAEEILQRKGVVFGVRFDEKWNTVFDYVESIDELKRFRGSKYVQAKVDKAYRQVERFLKQDRWVLFSGTPCQVAGLKNYLRHDYERLVAIDFICHGVPSPSVWQHYLKKETSCSLNGRDIKDINFREKGEGWKAFRLSMLIEDRKTKDESRYNVHHDANAFMELFWGDLILRPSCYECPARSGKSGSDITLGDFWGIEQVLPEWDDDKGTSLLMVNSQKGIDLLNQVKCEKVAVDFNDAIQCNESWLVDPKVPANRKAFFRDYEKYWDDYETYCYGVVPTRLQRFKRRMKNTIKKVLKRGKFKVQ